MSRWVDSTGQLVEAEGFQWIQDALKRIHPELFLCFDRNPLDHPSYVSPPETWCYAVCRIQRELQSDVVAGQYLTAVIPVPSVIAWSALQTEESFTPIRPSEWLVRKVGSLLPRQLDLGKGYGSFMLRAAENTEDRRVQRAEKQLEAAVSDAVEDSMTVVGGGGKVWTSG